LRGMMAGTQDKTKHIIDLIEEFVLHSPKIPVFNKLIIDEEKLFSLLDNLRSSLPEEINEAKNIVLNKELIMNNAAKRGKEIVFEAEERAKKLLDNSELLRKTQEEADLIKKDAYTDIDKRKEEADIYADQV